MMLKKIKTYIYILFKYKNLIKKIKITFNYNEMIRKFIFLIEK